MYNIPLFDLNYGKEEEKAVMDTLRTGWISTGPKCEELELLFSSELKVKYALSVSNCTAALHLACLALGLGPGDEVLCPSLTFAATVNAIKYVGAKPVFCDVVGNENFCISCDEIEKNITPNTKAIIVMHFAGFPCDMIRIKSIADKNGLKIIEDACHGPLSEYKGEKLGTIGDIGCFSFFSNKNISTGEGGMLVTNSYDIYSTVKILRSHGMTTMSYERASGHATEYDIKALGYNYRMDDIRASLAIAQIKKLRADFEKRKERRNIYIELLKNCDRICIPFKENTEYVSNYIFPIVLMDSNKGNRDRIRDELAKKGIQTSVHYPAVHKFSIYRDDASILPKTEYISTNEVTLPMYAKLTADDIKYITNALISVI